MDIIIPPSLFCFGFEDVLYVTGIKECCLMSV